MIIITLNLVFVNNNIIKNIKYLIYNVIFFYKIFYEIYLELAGEGGFEPMVQSYNTKDQLIDRVKNYFGCYKPKLVNTSFKRLLWMFSILIPSSLDSWS